jgi:uncharacterized protein
MMEDLLDILCCPETHQGVKLADPALIASINTRIKAGMVKNRGGKIVSEPIDGALVREDRKFLYPIRAKIPVMLIDEGIPLQE